MVSPPPPSHLVIDNNVNHLQARHFKEQDIDEFRECFYLYARSGQIKTMDELTVIMRSLGMSPTITELKSFMKDKGGKISFADFLDVMHSHTKKESIPKELIEAFRGMDPQRKVSISLSILTFAKPDYSPREPSQLKTSGTSLLSGERGSVLERVSQFRNDNQPQ